MTTRGHDPFILEDLGWHGLTTVKETEEADGHQFRR